MRENFGTREKISSRLTEITSLIDRNELDSFTKKINKTRNTKRNQELLKDVLFYAAQKNKAEFIEVCAQNKFDQSYDLNKRIDFYQKNSDQLEYGNEIFLAIRHRDPAAVNQLVEMKDQNNPVPNYKEKLLRSCACYNSDECALVLLAKSANPNAIDKNGLFPLMWAAKSDNLEVTKSLLKHGAKYYQTYTGPIEEIRGNTPLHFAAKENSGKIINWLCQKGARNIINQRNEHGETPLVLAAKNRSLEAAKELIKNDCQIKKLGDVTVPEYTPLHYAAQYGNTKMAVLLLSNAAHINVWDDFERTPLHYAAMYNKPKIFEYLMLNDANVNPQDIDGNTPLHLAVQYKAIKVIKTIIDFDYGSCTNPEVKFYFPNYNLKNNNGRTAFQLALDAKDEELIEIFETNLTEEVRHRDEEKYPE